MNLFADLHQLHLLRPWWLLAAVPALLLTLLLWRARSGGGDWARAIAPELLQPLLEQNATSTQRRWLPLLLIGWLLATIGLSGPAWQQLPQPVLQRSDALVIVFDLSLSMLTQDVTPSRLQRARYKIQDILAQRREGTTALVAYAGSAHIVVPLTDDAATLTNLLPALSPETMPLRGSDPVTAMQLAIELLQGAGEQRGRILLISDAISEHNADDITALLDRRWQLSILGIGTLQGAPLPLDGGFARATDGSIAVPKLSRTEFAELAQRSNGRYRELTADSSDIDALLAINPLDLGATRRTGDTRQFDQWQDRGALLALLLLPLAALLFRRGWLLTLILLALPLTLLPTAPAQALDWQQRWNDLWLRPDQQAARTLDTGDAAQAAKQFDDPGWRGTAHYRAGDYTAAANDFSNSNEAMRNGVADYNRGNALARAGKLQEALQAYDAALQADAAFDDARFNRELVEKLLQQQKSEKNQQSPQNSQDSPPSQQQEQQNQSQDNTQQADTQGDAQQRSQQNSSETQSSSQNDETAATPEGQTTTADSQQPEQSNDDGPREPTTTRQPSEPNDESKDTAEKSANALQQSREAAQTDQWLRQIPDEPGGLLQRKFLYEQRLRERHGETRAADQPAW